MSTAGDDDPKVALAIIYGLSYKEDSASGVKITSKALPFSLSTDSAVQKSYAKAAKRRHYHPNRRRSWHV